MLAVKAVASLGAFVGCLQPVSVDSVAFGQGDISFFIQGSFRLDDWVTFSGGEGPDGLEAFALEAVGWE